MKKKFFKLFYLFYFLFLISLLVYIFSYASIINKKVYDLFWIKSIQNRLYYAGIIKKFPCYKYDAELGYVPKKGICEWDNVEFNISLEFNNFFRKNNNRNIDTDNSLTPIAILGDSFTMGWGVNDQETYSAILEKQLQRKVLNFGVAGYGTEQEILRFLKSPYYSSVKKVIIQYCFNDLQSNIELELRNGNFEKNYITEKLIKNNDLSRIEKSLFAIRYFKSSFRLFYKDLKSFFSKTTKPDFSSHEYKFLEILEKYNFLDNKEIIVFYVNDRGLEFDNYLEKKFKNIHFIKVDLNKKKNFFILDSHLNSVGHLDLASQLFDVIKKKNW